MYHCFSIFFYSGNIWSKIFQFLNGIIILFGVFLFLFIFFYKFTFLNTNLFLYVCLFTFLVKSCAMYSGLLKSKGGHQVPLLFHVFYQGASALQITGVEFERRGCLWGKGSLTRVAWWEITGPQHFQTVLCHVSFSHFFKSLSHKNTSETKVKYWIDVVPLQGSN